MGSVASAASAAAPLRPTPALATPLAKRQRLGVPLEPALLTGPATALQPLHAPRPQPASAESAIDADVLIGAYCKAQGWPRYRASYPLPPSSSAREPPPLLAALGTAAAASAAVRPVSCPPSFARSLGEADGAPAPAAHDAYARARTPAPRLIGALDGAHEAEAAAAMAALAGGLC